MLDINLSVYHGTDLHTPLSSFMKNHYCKNPSKMLWGPLYDDNLSSQYQNKSTHTERQSWYRKREKNVKLRPYIMLFLLIQQCWPIACMFYFSIFFFFLSYNHWPIHSMQKKKITEKVVFHFKSDWKSNKFLLMATIHKTLDRVYMIRWRTHINIAWNVVLFEENIHVHQN